MPIPTLNVTKTPSSTPEANWLVKTYEEKRGDGLFWAVTSILGLLFTYTAGIIALIVSASRSGSKIFARSWLTRLASKPLSITPRIANWALFLGYKERLMKLRDVEHASERYFGLPAIDMMGKLIPPDAVGESLHSAIMKSVDTQKPLVITAKGGGGKTTLVNRLAYLMIKNLLFHEFTDYQPILVTSTFYEGDLLDAITKVLRERDGVAVDRNITRAQLESGNFLILFDGVSEVEGNQNLALKEMLETASHADYRSCRFVFTTRPGLNIGDDINALTLQPLTSETIKSELLPRFANKKQEKQILKHLDKFVSKPIEPLLFSMLLEQGNDESAISTRSQLYERYFRKLLLVDNEKSKELGDWIWRGWCFVLGAFAKWMNLDSGYRGVGLVHETLVKFMSKKESWFTMNSLLDEAIFLYNFPEKDKLKLLDTLRASRILKEDKRWRFEHDTFEEYFVAMHIIRLIREDVFPDFNVWSITDAQAESFLGVIEFLKEMADKETIEILLRANLPTLWKATLRPDLKDN